MDYSTLIDAYEAGGEQLRQGVAGLTREDLLARPIAGTWSIQEIVIHLMDSDLIGIDRMKRIAAQDKPLLLAYDENAFVRNLNYDLLPVNEAVSVLDMSRKMFALQLRAMKPEAFDRKGVHNETGMVTLGEQLKKYTEHLTYHLGFVHKKRKLLGK